MAYVGVKPAAITSATEAEIAGDLTVDTNTLHVDAANNRVGVGTVSPSTNLDITGSGGQVTVDANGHITSKQSLDAATAGGRIIGASNRGTVSQIDLAQTTSSADGGYIRFLTCDSGSTNPTERMRLLSGGGLTFNGDTAAANALDDYEEGSFSPTVVGTGGSGTFTYNQRNGRYVKVGNQVTIHIYLEVNITVAGSGTLRIDDLPFNGHASVYQAISTAHDTLSSSNAGAAFVQPSADFMEFTDGGSTSRRGFPGTGTRYIFVGGTYLTQF